jgi:hypothetical protein
MTRDSIAKKVRLAKEREPEKYCRYPGCLWRFKGHRKGFCLRHEGTLYARAYGAGVTYQDCGVDHG